MKSVINLLSQRAFGPASRNVQPPMPLFGLRLSLGWKRRPNLLFHSSFKSFKNWWCLMIHFRTQAMAPGFFGVCFFPLIALEVQIGSRYKLSDIIPSSIKGSIFGVVSCWGMPQIQCLDSPIPDVPSHTLLSYALLNLHFTVFGLLPSISLIFFRLAHAFRILFGSIGECARVHSPFNCPPRFRCAIIFWG